RLFVASGSTDHVAVLDTKRRRVIARLLDPPPAGPDEGTTPNALALSADGSRLYVAEADANAVAVFDLTAGTSNVASAHGADRLVGRIPTGWYPTAVLEAGDGVVGGSGKGRGAVANRGGSRPLPLAGWRDPRGPEYTLALISGAMMRVSLADLTTDALSRFSARVVAANGWTGTPERHRYPPFEHVVYIIKENRTYDQVFGDVRQGDGDSTLLF